MISPSELKVGTRVVIDTDIGYKRARPTRGTVVAIALFGDHLPDTPGTTWLAGSQNLRSPRLLLKLDDGTHLALPSSVFEAVHEDNRPPEAYIS